jgi:hypothetical protein
MLRQRVRVLLAQLVEQACGGFDIGKEKGDGARGLRGDRPARRLSTLEQSIVQGMGFSGRLDAKLIPQVVDTTLVCGTDLCHIPAGAM